jgi:hypothetical protein
MVEELREQLIQEEELDLEEESPRNLLRFRPWQRFVLAVLLLFDVALCGCMGLMMMGRVLPPF